MKTGALLSLGLLILSGCTMPIREKAAGEPRLRAYLTLSKEGAQQMMPGLAGRSLTVKLANVGSKPVRLDRRLLNIVELVTIHDGKGHELANVPSSIPHLFEAGDVLVISPGAFWQSESELRAITVEDLSGPYYRMSFCYDSTGVDYPVRLGIWKGKVCSEQAVVRREN